MAKIVSLDIYNKLKSTMDERCDGTKFSASIDCDTPKELEELDENLNFLTEHNIILTKPSQWIVLKLEPELLKSRVLKAEDLDKTEELKDLNLYEAYIQNPAFLKADANEVLSRMNHLKNVGIEYINKNGKYAPFLISERATNYMIKDKEKSSDNVLEFPSKSIVAEDEPKLQVEDNVIEFPSIDNENHISISDDELLELCNPLIELLDVNDNQVDWITQRITNLNAQGLEAKDVLREVFEAYCYNDQNKINLLYNTVDELVDNLQTNVRSAA